MHRFEYIEPMTLAETVQALAEHKGQAKILAGGTDLLIQMEMRKHRPEFVVYVMRVPELTGISVDDQGDIHIGAATTLREVEVSPILNEKVPVLPHSASTVGSIQIRNLATLGGNVCNAAPSGDTLPPLLVLGAQARIAGPNGERVAPLDDVFTGPGQTSMAPDELLVELIIPADAANYKALYYKQSVRQAMDIAVVGVSMAVKGNGKCEDAKIALGAVAPIPFRAKSAEEVVKGETADSDVVLRAAHKARDESKPITDQRGSADFRREMVFRLTRRGLATLLGV